MDYLPIDDNDGSSSSNSDENDNKCSKQKQKKRKQVHRKQHFRDEWLRDPKYKLWLERVENDAGRAMCRVCKKEFLSELSVIKIHLQSKNHIRNMNSVSNIKTSSLQQFISQGTGESQFENQVKSAEIMLCGFLAEHNLPFLVMDHLIPVLKNCFPDSKILKEVNLARTKSSSIINNVIAKTEKNELCQKLTETKFSILVDESTDISSTKTACIVVRYFDKNLGKVISQLWDLIQIFDVNLDEQQGASAEHLYNKIIGSFEQYKIPLENIVGFASDGCNTMMGKNNSVASRLKDNFPGIFISKCICHSLHICASEACKVLPRIMEDLARNIYNYFKGSSKRQFNFGHLQKHFDVEIHKILHPSQTRWLSLSQVVTRILEQWEPLLEYFSREWTNARLLAAEQIYKSLTDPFSKLYFKFLEWLLPKVVSLNQLFQTEKVILTDLHQQMVSLYKDLLCCYMDRKYVMSTDFSHINPADRSRCLSSNQMYLGVGVMKMLNDQNIKSNREMLKLFYERCLEFLIVLSCEIKKRYSFDDGLLPLMHCFKKENALSVRNRDSFPSLFPIMNLVPRLIRSDEHMQLIDDEWRAIPCYKMPENVKFSDNDDEFWYQLSNIKNGTEFLFKNVSDFVLNLLSLPHANADCERIFSRINLIKTKTRNKLIVKTVMSLLLSAQHVKKNGSCSGFKPTKSMIRLMNKAMYNNNSVTDSVEDQTDVILFESLEIEN